MPYCPFCPAIVPDLAQHYATDCPAVLLAFGPVDIGEHGTVINPNETAVTRSMRTTEARRAATKISRGLCEAPGCARKADRTGTLCRKCRAKLDGQDAPRPPRGHRAYLAH